MLEDQTEHTAETAKALHDTLDIRALHINMNLWYFKWTQDRETRWKEVSTFDLPSHCDDLITMH